MFSLQPPRHISTLPESDRIVALRQIHRSPSASSPSCWRKSIEAHVSALIIDPALMVPFCDAICCNGGDRNIAARVKRPRTLI